MMYCRTSQEDSCAKMLNALMADNAVAVLVCVEVLMRYIPDKLQVPVVKACGHSNGVC